MSKIVVGIDPGAKGAIAVVSIDAESKVNSLFACPVPSDVVGWKHLKASFYLLPSLCCEESAPFVSVYIEKVHSMPKQGVASMFSFGRSFGMWEGFFFGLGVDSVLYVEPQRWQKLIAPMAGMTTKEKSVRFAQLAFPTIDLVRPRCTKPHDGLADALCIAYYGAKKERAEHKEAL